MNTKRVLIRDAVTVALLSAAMGVILVVAWDGVYDQATTVEEWVLDETPGMTEGGIQAAAMFGLGLYLTWALLFAQNVRRRLQGYFILVGSLLALGVMAVFGTFLPQMEPTLQNLGAFAVGVGLAVTTELFESPLNDGSPSLMGVDREQSSYRGLLSEEGKELPFHAAARGLLFSLAFIFAGGILALVVSEASLSLIGLAILVTALFVWRLHAFLTYETNLDIEILGPTQSGKTLFLYGVYLTISGSDSFRDYDTKASWKGKMGLIEERQNRGDEPWGVESTEADRRGSVQEYWMEFIDTDGYWKKTRLSMTDFPGTWLYRLFRSDDGTETGNGEQTAATDGGTLANGADGRKVATDGGTDTDEAKDRPNEDEREWNIDGDEDVYEAFGSGGLANRLSRANIETVREIVETPEEELAGIFDDEDTAAHLKQQVENAVPVGTDGQQSDRSKRESEPEATDPDGHSRERRGRDDNQGEISYEERQALQKQLEDSLLEANKIVCMMDMRSAIESGHVIISDENRRGEKDSNDGSQGHLGEPMKEMVDICENVAQPEEIIYVATKSDLLLEEYPNDKPHKELGDIKEFTDWVNQRLDKPPFQGWTSGPTVNDTIYPVYYQTEETDDGNIKPVLEDGVMQPVGFEQLLKELVPE